MYIITIIVAPLNYRKLFHHTTYIIHALLTRNEKIIILFTNSIQFLSKRIINQNVVQNINEIIVYMYCIIECHFNVKCSSHPSYARNNQSDDTVTLIGSALAVVDTIARSAAGRRR